jgi:serine/threonine protein kinase
MDPGSGTGSDMTSNTYDNLCYEIYEQIYRRLERRDEERLRFAIKGTAKRVLHRDNLLRFFRSLLLPGNTAMNQFKLTEEDLVARMNERQLHDFLAILIFATCRIEAARTFTTKLVATDAWPVQDRRGKNICSLPADREELAELFGNVVTADKFFTKQACFCAVVIRKREEVRIENHEGQRLPYLVEQPLAKGSFGKVFKIRIAKGHFYDPQARTANLEPLDVARKDYLISSEFRAKGEREIMEKILTSSAQRCENILENYGGLEIGQTTYSLFMPLAICDLRAYMMEHHQTRPKTSMEKQKIILSAEGLAGGLNFLHNEMKTSDMEDLVCYHMDLKPSNILIFREKRGDETRNIWKLSDFGMARVKIRRRGQAGEREKDFNSWFLQRPKPQDPSLSATLNRRGEGTYLAPESISSMRSMNAESDVWSLGCVISVVFAYLEEGGEGVSRYQDARMQHANADGYDRFFLRDRRFRATQVHPTVSRWHSYLIDKASQRDPDEGDSVKFMLRYLEDAVFKVNQSRRRGVKEVQKMLLKTFKKYKILGEAKRVENPGRKQPRSLGKSMWQKMQSRWERIFISCPKYRLLISCIDTVFLWVTERNLPLRGKSRSGTYLPSRLSRAVRFPPMEPSLRTGPTSRSHSTRHNLCRPMREKW